MSTGPEGLRDSAFFQVASFPPLPALSVVSWQTLPYPLRHGFLARLPFGGVAGPLVK